MSTSAQDLSQEVGRTVSEVSLTGPRRCQLVVLALAAIAGSAAASEQPRALDPITVDATRLERDWPATAAAHSVIDGERVQRGQQGLQLDESLDRVPGVFTQNRYNFAQDLRISIRGFGARSAFGIRGLKLIVDGIPETLVDGQAQVSSIDLTAVEQIEVIRGPSSALYGNATGGVVEIETQDPPVTPVRRLRADAGSFGYYRQSAQAGAQHDDWGYHVSANNIEFGGFREHSEFDKRLLNGKFHLAVGDDARLETVVRLLDAPDTLDPGSLTRDQASENRRQARPRNVELDARQTVSQETLGLTFRDAWGPNQDFRARAFYTHRDFIQYLPFEGGGVVTFDRDFYGTGLQYTRRGRLAGRDAHFTAGVDAEFQRDDRQRFDNDAGDKGDRTFDQLERARSIGLFAQNVLALSPRLDLTVGVRYDRVAFEIDDRFIPGGDPDEDDSGKRRFSEGSGNLGLGYALTDTQRLYATVGTAFETPTFTEFADPDGSGGFNPDIEPQKAVNYELGAKGHLGPRLRYDVAIFRVDVRDEIVLFESAGGRDFFENSGRSRRQGIETQLAYDFAEYWSVTGAFTYSDFEFEEFVDRNGNDFAGQRIPGLPESRLFGELAYRHPGAGFAVLDVQIPDELFADNANEVKVAGYGVVNGRLGVEERLGHRPVTLTFGVNNLLDEDYFDNVRINAFGGRYFEPAPGRHIYAGVELEL